MLKLLQMALISHASKVMLKILLSMVVQQQVVILEFLQKMNTGPLLQHFRSFDIDVKSL